jgi:hypothetical protein
LYPVRKKLGEAGVLMDLVSLPNFIWRDQSVRITIIATLVCAD